ncbi:MAG TPA: ATP-binding protein [Chryseosolibacter sp.]
MVINPRGLALLLAAGISAVTGIALAFFEGLDFTGLLTAAAITFISALVLIAAALELTFSRKVRKLQLLARRLSGEQDDNGQPDIRDPFDSIARDMRSFADRAQKEIDDLKKVEAFRKDFIADISHELKTPIFAAQGYVHTLLDGAMKDKAVRSRFLRKAAKSLDGLDILVQDLLTLSQIETGQIKMRMAEVDLYQLTRDVFEQLEGKSAKKEITLRIEGPIRKVMAYADGQRISQVMTNLISNAIKHSSEGQQVEVSFTEKKKSVVTRVTDFGEGIPKEHIGRIFERFYRVDKSRSREKGGTGLGLAIVKHILDGHHSRPEVESAPGKGSTFSFKLPRVKTEKQEDGEHNKSAKN